MQMHKAELKRHFKTPHRSCMVEKLGYKKCFLIFQVAFLFSLNSKLFYAVKIIPIITNLFSPHSEEYNV